VVVLSLLSKYLLRLDGRHIFNPSNVGITAGLLLIGPDRVFSEHLWWGPLGAPVVLSLAVVLGGAWWVLRQVKMIAMSAAFLATFSMLVGVLAITGHHYYAIWHQGPVTGGFYWATVAASPELLIFVFFMIVRSPDGTQIGAWEDHLRRHHRVRRGRADRRANNGVRGQARDPFVAGRELRSSRSSTDSACGSTSDEPTRPRPREPARRLASARWPRRSSGRSCSPRS